MCEYICVLFAICSLQRRHSLASALDHSLPSFFFICSKFYPPGVHFPTSVNPPPIVLSFPLLTLSGFSFFCPRRCLAGWPADSCIPRSLVADVAWWRRSWVSQSLCVINPKRDFYLFINLFVLWLVRSQLEPTYTVYVVLLRLGLIIFSINMSRNRSDN